jgi:hypothetical protein
MSVAIPTRPQYAFMAWCSGKAQGQLYLYLRIQTGEHNHVIQVKFSEMRWSPFEWVIYWVYDDVLLRLCNVVDTKYNRYVFEIGITKTAETDLGLYETYACGNP